MSQSNTTLGERIVEDVFNIDLDDLHLRQEAGHPYWVKAYDFYENVKRMRINSLSDHQLNWLQRIEDALGDEDRREQ